MTDKENSATAVRTETMESAWDIARIYHETDTPLYLHSAPGIGKSALMRQLSAHVRKQQPNQPGTGFIDIRVGTMLPEDLTGIPVPNLEKKVAEWLRATFWPNAERDGETGIIAFDELSDASRALQSCIYRVVLERQIGEYKLPPGWWPVAAGNRREDRAAAQSLSTALANRFAHCHIRADAEVWARWAAANNIDPMLIGFLKFRQELIHSMAGADLLAFPSPRSWERCSKIFSYPDAGLRFKLIAGNVGEGAALEVESFFKALELPDFDDIVNRPLKAMLPTDPGSRYALSSLIARKLDAKNFPNVLKYIDRDGYGADFATVTVLEATKREPALCDTKSFNEWAKSNDALNV